MTMLFNRVRIFDVLETQRQKIKQEVQALDANYVLSASEEDLIRSLVDQLSLEVPTMDESSIHMDYGEADIDARSLPNRHVFDRSRPVYIKGVQVTVTIPFEGDAGFFQIQPQTFVWQDLPEAKVSMSELRITYLRTDHDAAAIKQAHEMALGILKRNLANLKTSVDEFNGQLERQVRSMFKERKTKLLADAQMAEAIGIPMNRRHGVPMTYAVPIQKRKPKIERPPVTTGKFQPEPVLPMEEYENILTIIRNMVQVMEQSPKAFEGMGEEDLRTHFLVQLNGQYEGRATGETFNFQGKTDILIREEGRNVFIAECKFWRGEKVLLETIDQLLSYLSWRDTKTALLVFNRNTNFTDVLRKIAETVPAHKCFKRDLGKTGESSFRYVFQQPNDSNRELVLTVIAFDIPTAEHRSK